MTLAELDRNVISRAHRRGFLLGLLVGAPLAFFFGFLMR